MRRLWFAAAAAVVALTWSVASVAPAVAHTRLVGSTPAVGSVQDAAVTRLSLTFGSTVRPDFARVLVRGENGVDRVVGAPAVNGSTVAVTVRPLDVAGGYRVVYRVVGADGHEVAGEFGFRVSPVGARAARAATSAGAAGRSAAGLAGGPGSSRGWTGAVVVLGFLGLGCLTILRVRLRSAQDAEVTE